VADWVARLGVIHASTKNAVNGLRSGGVVLVFPGGIYDAYRPTLVENIVDFNGRTGYVRSAMDAGAPIVPAVSIGIASMPLSRFNRPPRVFMGWLPRGTPVANVASGPPKPTPPRDRPTRWLTIDATAHHPKSICQRRHHHG
jgi:hypothetical protein